MLELLRNADVYLPPTVFAGARPELNVLAPTELDAVKESLSWALPGDLLILTVHGQRTEVLELLERLRERHWKPGDPLEAP